VLLAEHKGEKTDIVAQILYMKATLYGQVLHNDAKAQELLNQLKTDFKDTPFVANLEKQEAAEAAAKANTGFAGGRDAKFPDFNERTWRASRFPSQATRARWCWLISGRRGAGLAAANCPTSSPPTRNITRRGSTSSA
jgi:hypothetical protein